LAVNPEAAGTIGGVGFGALRRETMRGRLVLAMAALMLGACIWVVVACGGSGGSETTGEGTGATDAATSTTVAATGEPVRIVFNREYSSPLVYDCALVEKGILTALATLGYQVAGRPIEYATVDNAGDPVLAVEQTRELVEIDRDGDEQSEPVDYMCGPLSSEAVAGVTFFLSHRAAKRERIPQCSVTGQPRGNIPTSGKVGFIPNGVYSSYGYYLGRYAAESLRYRTVNCIHYADQTASDMQAGFERGFTEWGGTITSVTYVQPDTTDFSTYFAALQPADCTMFWVRGKGALPFVRQYAESGLTGRLLVPQASNYTESQLLYLADLGLGVDMIACDIYTPMLDNPANEQFMAAYRQLYPGEYPTAEVYGGWQAIMLYANALETLEGNTSDTEAVIDAMAHLTMDTPAGPITMRPYGFAKSYVPTRNFFIVRSRDVGGGRIAWVPVMTYPQVLLAE
jgi:branched-chain amino acid transport system substrate-binding protein